jgi:hypothetical protein
MAEFGAGTRPRSSASRFRFTKFLYEICWKRNVKISSLISRLFRPTHLQDQVTQLLLLLCNPFAALLVLFLQLETLSHGVGGQADPSDLFFLLRYDVHGHQYVQGVVDTTSYVLLIVGGGGAVAARDFLVTRE